MKKIKLRNSTCTGNSLSREELKQVFGGSGSRNQCSYEGEGCTYMSTQGIQRSGTCRYLPFSYGLVCWGG